MTVLLWARLGSFQTARFIPLVDCDIILKGHTAFSPQFFIKETCKHTKI